MSFLSKLMSAAKKNDSWLCIGLDPVPGLIPDLDILSFNRSIIENTADLVCAYKPNLAFYETLGIEGLQALEKTLEYIPGDIPVIGDAKRADIGNTAEAYARAMFDIWGFDATTVNPYFGQDSLEPFFKYREKGIFVLCKTSNPGSGDFQDVECLQNATSGKTTPLWEMVALKARQWNREGNIGLVVGATYPEQLKRLRQSCPDLPFLIPGVGTQGGELRLAVSHGSDEKGEKAIISISRSIIYASKDRNFALASRESAIKTRDAINDIIGSLGDRQSA